jgi:hypothetical protein
MMAQLRNRMNRLHEKGTKVILYIGPVFSLGDAQKRTGLFRFYDKEWDDYVQYLGRRPEQDPVAWTQRDEHNRPKIFSRREATGFYLCPNNPYARQYTKGIIKLIIESGADGIFFDGPLFKDGACFCSSCKDRFLRRLQNASLSSETNALLPDTAMEKMTVAHGPLWIERQKFFADSLGEFLKDMKAFTESQKPGFIVTANYWIENPYETLRNTAADLELWSRFVNPVFCESKYGYGPHVERGRKFSNSSLYRQLVALSRGKTVALLRTSAKATSSLGSENLTKLCITEATANGAVWQFHKLDNDAQRAAIDLNMFLVRNAHLFKKFTPYADVALVISPRQIFYGSIPCDAQVSRFLADRHIVHRMISLEYLGHNDLEVFGTLILPGLPMLDNAAYEKVLEFVEKGGDAILFGDNGKYDENGKKRHSLNNVFMAGQALKGTGGGFRYGKGCAFIFPQLHLKQGSYEELEREDKETLSRSLYNATTKATQYPLLKTDRDSTLEFNLMRSAEDDALKLTVHIVNYGVERDGRIHGQGSFPLMVKLPKGYNPQGVRWYTPDGPVSGIKVNYSITTKGLAEYTSFTIPGMGIYGTVLVDLKKLN